MKKEALEKIMDENPIDKKVVEAYEALVLDLEKSSGQKKQTTNYSLDLPFSKNSRSQSIQSKTNFNKQSN